MAKTQKMKVLYVLECPKWVGKVAFWSLQIETMHFLDTVELFYLINPATSV